MSGQARDLELEPKMGTLLRGGSLAVGWRVLLFALAMSVLPLLLKNVYYVNVLNFVGLHGMQAIGLSLLMGYAGQISLGHAAFYGLGAYGSAILTTRYGVHPLPALVIAMFITALIAYVIGRPTLRLKGHYLALATVGFGIIVHVFFVQTSSFTGGTSGIRDIPYLSLSAFAFDNDLKWYYLIWALVCLILFFSLNIVDSRPGRALRAIRDSEMAASAMGIDIAHYKLQVFVLSAVYSSLAGSLYTHYITFISPQPFGLNLSIELVTMVVVGGLASLWGALFGAGVLNILGELLREFEGYKIPFLNVPIVEEESVIIYGALLIAIMIFMPEGVIQSLGHYLKNLGRRKETLAASSEEEIEAIPLTVRERKTREECGAVLLQVNSVRKAFGGLEAVNDVSFEVWRGQVKAIIGPNGAGKTTLFNLVTGFYMPTTGSVQLDGSTLSGLSPYIIATQGVARTFQNIQLFDHMTVLENVMVGRHLRSRGGILAAALRLPGVWAQDRDSRERALEKLAMVGLTDKAHELAMNLSHGQRREVEIARALATEPTLLLLDEPVAGLSMAEAIDLIDLIYKINEMGITIILVEHDMGLVMDVADEVVVLDYGRKIAEGDPDSIRNNPDVIAAYLGEDYTSAPDTGAKIAAT